MQNSGITPLSGSDANPDSYIIIDVLSEDFHIKEREREREKERKRDRQADRQTDNISKVAKSIYRRCEVNLCKSHDIKIEKKF